MMRSFWLAILFLPAMGSAQITRSEAEAKILNMQVQDPHVELRLWAMTASDKVLGVGMLSKDTITVQYALREARDRGNHPALAPYLAKLAASPLPGRTDLSATAVRVLAKFPSRSVRQSLHGLLAHRQHEVAVSAAAGLVRQGDYSGIPVLQRKLSKVSDDLAYEAASSLWQKRRREAIATIIARAKAHPDNRLWLTLAAMGDPTGCAKTRAMLRNEAYAGDRAHCATALGWSGDRSNVPALIAALKDRSAMPRQFAADALGHLGDRRAIPALERAAKEYAPDFKNAKAGNYTYHEAVLEALQGLRKGRPAQWAQGETPWLSPERRHLVYVDPVH